MSVFPVVRRIAIGLTVVLTILFASPSMGRGGTVYSQPLQAGTTSYLSNPTEFVADNWKVNANTTISEVSWWGTYNDGIAPATDALEILFYGDDVGHVGTQLSDFSIGDNRSRTSTGQFDADGRPLYLFDCILPSGGFTATANTSYYVRIASTSGDIFAWTGGSGSDGDTYFSGGPEHFGDRAFTLSSVPEPSTLVLLGIAALGLLGYARRRISRQIVTFLAVAVIALAAGSAPVCADIINGGFETGNLAYHYDDGYPGPPDDSTIDGWTAQFGMGNGLSSMANVQTVGGGASEGNQFVRLDATVVSSGNGTVPSQISAGLETAPSFLASAGDILLFDYYGSALGFSSDASGSLTAIISSGGSLIATITLGNQGSWTTVSQTLPVSGLYDLQFWASANARDTMVLPPGGVGPPIFMPNSASASMNVDNVRLTPVPEPSTFVLLGIGAIGLLGYARRRAGWLI